MRDNVFANGSKSYCIAVIIRNWTIKQHHLIESNHRMENFKLKKEQKRVKNKPEKIFFQFFNDIFNSFFPVENLTKIFLYHSNRSDNEYKDCTRIFVHTLIEFIFNFCFLFTFRCIIKFDVYIVQCTCETGKWSWRKNKMIVKNALFLLSPTTLKQQSPRVMKTNDKRTNNWKWRQTEPKLPSKEKCCKWRQERMQREKKTININIANTNTHMKNSL